MRSLRFTVLLLLSLMLTPLAKAYYTNNGRLYDSYHRDQFIDDARDINLNFDHDNKGFILFNDGTLKLVKKVPFGIEVDSIDLSRSVKEISYPYFLSDENNLFYYNSNTNKIYHMLNNIDILCLNYAIESPIHTSSKARVIILYGDRWNETNRDIPTHCKIRG